MKIGFVLPQSEIKGPSRDLVDFTLALEKMGFDHLLAYDHILGADSMSRSGWTGPYDHRDPFLEPLVAFGYLAGQTQIDFATGVLVLPQRQTALVAKQVATLESLAPGRLRLGVGIGWNDVEYQALGADFSNRGARIEEQVVLLRELLGQPLVRFEGKWESVDRAGLLPRPARVTPVWMGSGAAEIALRRVGRLADGWIPTPNLFPGHGLEAALEMVRDASREADRPSRAVGLEGHVSFAHGDSSKLREHLDAWREVGADYAVINVMRGGAEWPAGHLGLAELAAAAFA